MPEGDIYIGLMSGTSMDAVDTALVQFDSTKPTILAYEQFPIADEIRAGIRRIDSNTSIEEVTKYSAIMAHLFAGSVQRILDLSKIDSSEVTAIGSHGQTVLHLPDDLYPRTLQIGDPNIIAHRTGISTITDFRLMDMASGGQGAPLAPAFHETAFRAPGVERVILNLGGIANVTLLPSNPDDAISGFDTGPGNGLLDDWNQKHNNTEMDRNSDWAASGKIDDALIGQFMSDPYFALTPAKSSGRDYFNLDWVTRQIARHSREPNPADVQATLLNLTIESIAQAIETYAPETSEIYVCGGGAHNKGMMRRLKERLTTLNIYDTGELGLDPDAIEAITFAWLAKQTIEGRPGNKCSVTGASKPEILGGIYQSFSEPL